MELLKEFQDQYAVLEKERQELANAEKLFDLPITKFDGLIEVDRDLRNMDKVYELYEAQRVREYYFGFSTIIEISKIILN